MTQRDELVFGRATDSERTGWDLWRLGPDGETDVVLRTEADEYFAQVSPDGRYHRARDHTILRVKKVGRRQ